MPEKAIMRNMTFYDILTLVIPSSMVVAGLQLAINPIVSIPETSWIVRLAIFGIIISLGFIIKNIALQKDKEIFQNNINDIREKYKKLYQDAQDATSNPSDITLNDYYRDYYLSVQNYSGSHIHILEAHVAFLRTIRFVAKWLMYICVFGILIQLSSLIVPNFAYNSDWCSFQNFLPSIYWIIVGLLCGLYAFLSYTKNIALNTQKMIYECVAYDSYYIRGQIQGRPLSLDRRILYDEEKQEAIKQERRLKIAFATLSILVAIMLIVFVCNIGSNSSLSDRAQDYADFSTYIGAIGTMLFTALYAYAFIQLQGAVVNITHAQSESNAITKQKEGEQKVKKNILILVLAIEGYINTSLELLKSVSTNYSTKKLPDDHFKKISAQLSQIRQYITIAERYGQSHLIFTVTASNRQFEGLIKDIKMCADQCDIYVKQWHQQGREIRYRSSIRDILTTSFTLTKQLETMIMSTML